MDWLEEAWNTVSSWWDAGTDAIGDIASNLGGYAADAAGSLAGAATNVWDNITNAGSYTPPSGTGSSIVGDSWGPGVGVGNFVAQGADTAANTITPALDTSASAAITGAFGGTGTMGADPMQYLSGSMYSPPSSIGTSDAISAAYSSPSRGLDVYYGAEGVGKYGGLKGAYEGVKGWVNENPELAKLGSQYVAGLMTKGSGPSKTGQLEQDRSRREAYEAQKNQDANAVMGLMRDPYAGIRSAATMGVRNAANERATNAAAGLTSAAKESINRKGRIQLGAAQSGAISEGFNTAQKENAGVIQSASGLRAQPQGNSSLAESYGADRSGETDAAYNLINTALGDPEAAARRKRAEEDRARNPVGD